MVGDDSVGETCAKEKFFQSAKNITTHTNIWWEIKEEIDLQCISIPLGEHARRKLSRGSAELLNPNKDQR